MRAAPAVTIAAPLGVSLRAQGAGLAAAMVLVAFLHWPNDGLWFQGDAPRHAANGLFAWDLVRAQPVSPLSYALAYYARYPVIAPLAYPPLFYIGEGLLFAAVAPSAHLAKLLVLGTLAVLAGYTMAWCRRWVHPAAGWAGASLPLVPALTLYSNAVLLNVPATACAFAACYHARRWLEDGAVRQLASAIGAAIAAVLTYYLGAVLLVAPLVWVASASHAARAKVRAWLAALAVLGAVPLVVAGVLLPTHAARHMPNLRRFADPDPWLFYLVETPFVVGPVWLALGAAGLVLVVVRRRCRHEGWYLWSWLGVTFLCFLALPARSDRYVLIVAPVFVIAGAIALRELLRSSLPRAAPVVVLVAALGLSVLTAVRIRVPRVAGFDQVAAYLREAGPGDAVLYDGKYDGVFGFYLRAFDPAFEQRMVLASKLVFEAALDTRFQWIYKGRAETSSDVVSAIRERSGCRWVAVEEGPRLPLSPSQLLLRESLESPHFELVRTFEIESARTAQVKLYRLVGDLTEAPPLDLSFPSFGGRVYKGVLPVSHRP